MSDPYDMPSPMPRFLMGTDLVYIPRLEKAQQRFGASFFHKLLSDQELQDATHPRSGALQLEKVAARLAAKEALAKALGVGLNGLGWGKGLNWQEVEVERKINAPPHLKLIGRAKMFSDKQGITRWQLSLTHDGEYAVATVLGVGLV